MTYYHVKKRLHQAKNNVSLFSRLFIAWQTRDGDLDNFFSHENQSSPPPLSKSGRLRPAKSKSDIVDCLLQEVTLSSECSLVDCKIFDGVSLVNMLSPNSNYKTFFDYCIESFIPYLEFNTHSMKQRVDLVFDRYFKGSLKSATLTNHVIGVH